MYVVLKNRIKSKPVRRLNDFQSLMFLITISYYLNNNHNRQKNNIIFKYIHNYSIFKKGGVPDCIIIKITTSPLPCK